MNQLSACRRLQVFVPDAFAGRDFSPSGPGHLLNIELWVRTLRSPGSSKESGSPAQRDMLINLRELDPLIERVCLNRALTTPNRHTTSTTIDDGRWEKWLQGLSQDFSFTLKDMNLDLHHLRIGHEADWGMELWPES